MAKTGPKSRLSDVKRVHRHFLYLNGDEVLSSLASLRGGDVDAVLETSLKAIGGNAGIKFSLFGAGLNFGGKGRRETKREVQLRQTTHSAVTVLLEQLYEQDGVGGLKVAGDLSPSDENLVVQFEACVQLPESWAPATRKVSWIERPFMSKLGRQALALADAKDDGLVAQAELGPPPDGKPNGVLLNLREKYLLVEKPEDFGRRATVVGQLEMVAAEKLERLVLGEDDSGQYVRLVSANSNGSEIAQPTGAQGADFALDSVCAVVRPFCMFR